MPARTFLIEDLVNSYLLGIEFGAIKYEGDAPVLSRARVSGVIDAQNQIRLYGTLASAAHPDGTVRVKFGAEVLQEQWEDVPCPSLDDVETPPTPGTPTTPPKGYPKRDL